MNNFYIYIGCLTESIAVCQSKDGGAIMRYLCYTQLDFTKLYSMSKTNGIYL